MKSSFHIITTVITLVIATAPAAAAFKIATYSGTISSGADQTGVFGTVGQDLTGLSYIITYTYDRTNVGNQYEDITGGLEWSYGGTVLHRLSPIVDSSVTINGIVKHVSGASFGQLWRIQGSSLNPFISHTANYDRETASDNSGNGIVSYIRSPTIDVRYTENVAPTVQTVQGGIQFLHFNKINRTTYAFARAAFFGPAVYSVGDTDIGAVSSALTGEVPEPGTWAMLIAGFGLTGASLRRKRLVQMA